MSPPYLYARPIKAALSMKSTPKLALEVEVPKSGSLMQAQLKIGRR